MIKKSIDSIKSARKMKTLEKELIGSPLNEPDDGSYLVWKNNKLGSDLRINIYNLWYGIDITKKGQKTKKDIVLLFPNSTQFDQKISRRSDLDKIILNKDNWQPVYLPSRINTENDKLVLDNKNKINSPFDYFKYLVDKKKMVKAKTIIKKATESFKNNKDKSILKRLKIAKKTTSNAIKDAKLNSLAKYLFKNRKSNDSETTYGCAYYNSKLFQTDITEGNITDTNTTPYWYGNLLFTHDKVKQDQAILMLPSTNEYFNESEKHESIKNLEKKVLNKKNWKELSVIKSTLQNLNHEKNFTELSVYFKNLKEKEIIKPDKKENKKDRKIAKSISAGLKANQAKEKLDKTKTSLKEKQSKLEELTSAGKKYERSATPANTGPSFNKGEVKTAKDKVAAEKHQKVIDELTSKLAERNAKRASAKVSEEDLKNVYNQKMKTLVLQLKNKQGTVGMYDDQRIIWLHKDLDPIEVMQNNYSWYGTGGDLSKIDPKTFLKNNIILAFPAPHNLAKLKSINTAKDIEDKIFDVKYWEMRRIEIEELEQEYKDIMNNNGENHIVDINDYFKQILKQNDDLLRLGLKKT